MTAPLTRGPLPLTAAEHVENFRNAIDTYESLQRASENAARTVYGNDVPDEIANRVVTKAIDRELAAMEIVVAIALQLAASGTLDRAAVALRARAH